MQIKQLYIILPIIFLLHDNTGPQISLSQSAGVLPWNEIGMSVTNTYQIIKTGFHCLLLYNLHSMKSEVIYSKIILTTAFGH